MHRGVGGSEGNGTLEELFREVVPVHFEVDPAEAVQKRAVNGIGVDGLLDHGQGFVELLSPVCEHVSEVVQHRRVVLIQVQCFPEGLFCLRVLVLTFVESALEEVHLFFVRKVSWRRHRERPAHQQTVRLARTRR